MADWKQALICPTTTIRDAMRGIDRAAQRIGLVCDGDGRLLGTLTDGDIRRGLLADAQMDDPVLRVMNPSPKTARQEESREHCLAIMNQFDILSLPILDVQGRVVDLETLHHALHRPRLDNPVFLMAGGFGTRLRPLTDHCPKPMLQVGGKPMLGHLVQRFIDLGFHNFYISTHYLADQIREHFGDGTELGVNITYVHEESPLGTGGALGLLPDDLPKLPLILMNGDVLTKVDFTRLLNHHQESDCDATMCVREFEYQVPFGVIESSDGRISAMTEKPVYRYHVNAGIYVLNPECVTSVARGKRIDLPTLLEQRMEQGHQVGVYTSFDYWLDIGRIEDYQRAQNDIKGLF